MIEESGFERVTIGSAIDTFAGASGERNAKRFEVFGYPFLAYRRP
jgi:hypothetical protein